MCLSGIPPIRWGNLVPQKPVCVMGESLTALQSFQSNGREKLDPEHFWLNGRDITSALRVLNFRGENMVLMVGRPCLMQETMLPSLCLKVEETDPHSREP